MPRKYLVRCAMLRKIRFVKGLMASLSLLLLMIFIAAPAQAIWRTVLSEHFSASPTTWPWGNWSISPSSPTPYSWGVTTYIYKWNGWDEQSLWCVGNPPILDPEFDPYPASVNSWAKWGPINLSTAVAARASFWYYSVTEPVQDYFRWGGWGSSQFSMYEYDRVSGNVSPQWLNGKVDFDSLAGGTQSLLGDASVWLEFQFVSDADNIRYIGSFIDELTISWDDGLFDLFAELPGLAALDSMPVAYPFVGDTLRFSLNWSAEGTGTTPMFDITCTFDGELFYTERRNAEIGNQQIIGINTYTTPWVVTPDSHTVVWVVDAANEIAEAYETNNDTSLAFASQMPNVPPMITVLHPTWGDTANNQFLITWEDYDPDDNAYINLYWNFDTLSTQGILIPGAVNISEDDTTDSFLWNTSDMTNGTFWVLALIADGAEYVYDYSDGPLIIDHDWSYQNWLPDPVAPQTFALESIYPNPFNSSTVIRLAAPRQMPVEVRIFDSRGRLQATLFQGNLPAGYNEITWSPENLPSGLYMIEVQAQGQQFFTKVIYMK